MGRESPLNRALEQCLLRCRYIFGLALPGLQHRLLQGATIGKRQQPGFQRKTGVDGIEVGRGLLRAQASGEKVDARYGRWHAAAQHPYRGCGDGFGIGLLVAVLAGYHHVGFEQDMFERHVVPVQGMKDFLLHHFGHLGTAGQCVVAIHQNFRLDDGHNALRLTDRRVARQHLGIGADAQRRRVMFADGVDLTPLGKACALLFVLLQPLGQPIEAIGDEVAR